MMWNAQPGLSLELSWKQDHPLLWRNHSLLLIGQINADVPHQVRKKALGKIVLWESKTKGHKLTVLFAQCFKNPVMEK